MTRLLSVATLGALLALPGPANAQPADPTPNTTAENCQPQPDCRVGYSTLQPGSTSGPLNTRGMRPNPGMPTVAAPPPPGTLRMPRTTPPPPSR